MEWLFPNTDEVTSNSIVDDALHGDIRQFPIHLKDAHPWSNDDGELTRPIKTSILVMLLKDIEGHVEDFEEIPTGGRGDVGLGQLSPGIPLLVMTQQVSLVVYKNVL